MACCLPSPFYLPCPFTFLTLSSFLALFTLLDRSTFLALHQLDGAGAL